MINTTNHLLPRFAAVLLLLGVNAWLNFDAIRDLRDADDWVRHTYLVLGEIDQTMALTKNVESGARAYIITGKRTFLEPYEVAAHKITDHLEPLYSLTADNPSQHRRVGELSVLIARKLQISRQQARLASTGHKAAAEALVMGGAGVAAMNAVRAKVGEMRASELILLRERAARSAASVERAFITLLAGSGASLLLLALVFAAMTHARRQQKQLTAAFSRLQKLEAARDSLTTMLVHDLRTPLTAILGPLDLLQSGQLGEMNELQHEIVAISTGSGWRLLSMVNELLDISKMEAGQMTVRHESVAAARLIDEAVKATSLSEFAGAARIERGVPANLPLLQADEELLTRVLINLLGNAVKFTLSSGKITLDALECVPRDALPPRLQPPPTSRDAARYDAPSLLFRVRDTGEGIPAADLDRVFDKFEQVAERKAGRKLSTGLGLTFCKLAVDAHGGFIWVESELGQGSTFCFTVPLRAVSVLAAAPAKKVAT